MHVCVSVCHAHAVELACIIGKTAKCVSPEDAMTHVGGYALALDLTDRKAQTEAKKKVHLCRGCAVVGLFLN